MRRIPLTKGKYALVDNEDFKELSAYKWGAAFNPRNGKGGSWVAHRNIWHPKERKQETVYMHRQIMKAPKGMQVDHRNHNTLDNRRENLRLCTSAQNMMNLRTREDSSSGYKGVYLRNGKWSVYISFAGRLRYIGRFKRKYDAVLCHRVAAQVLHGEFAYCHSL